eukprot:Hpha_TRINITY_DN15254_c3_g10::TRINITY_DN15254_c3_g10_i1::g.65878::m.65878
MRMLAGGLLVLAALAAGEDEEPEFAPLPTPVPNSHGECFVNTTHGVIDLTKLAPQQYHLTVDPCELGFKFYFTTGFCLQNLVHGAGGQGCPGQFGGKQFYVMQMDEEASVCQFAWSELQDKPVAQYVDGNYEVTYTLKGQQSGTMFPFGAPRYLHTTLVCDLSLHDDDVQPVEEKVQCSGQGHDYDPWHFSWSFRTRWACPSAPPSPPPPPPVFSDVGALALLLFGVASITYLAAGFAYNKGVRKTEGMVGSLPHVAFWKDLPFLVKDGMVFTYDSIRDRWRGASVPRIQVRLKSGPQPRTYTSI